MSEDKKIIISESVQLGAVQATSPQDVIERAESVATPLAKLIEKKKLFTLIGNKKYVQVDGWATLGAMLGVLPREVKSLKIDNGYEAYVELVRTTDGAVIGGASAICTREERNWNNRDDYAIKSMAATRATGKAYRLAFSWIMNLAGYESTPAEEMTVEAEFHEKPVQKSGSIRPLAPDKLAEMLAMKADIHRKGNHKAADNDRKKLIANLNTLVQGDDNLRHELTEYLVGQQSVKDLDDGNVLALNDWLGAYQADTGEWLLDAMAWKEYKRIVEEVFGNGSGK